MSAEKNSNIRLRFAPSPTGFLHIGSLRAALFGYLLAKSWGGKFILRIEDTDRKREVSGAADKLIEILEKVGILFDEGPHIGGASGPYIQSQRQEYYNRYAQELLSAGKAYRCFCSEERLVEMRAAQEDAKQPPRYDRRCRNLSAEESAAQAAAGEPFVIRQKMPLAGEVSVYDELRGEVKFPAADLDDHVLIKSDGIPTYQFANVVDDHLMEISHVTRAVEWLPSYPKNFLLYQDFGWTPPKFIHMPLILNKEGGGKLSKRRGDVFVEDYLAKGYLPEALINFCALLGWHPKNDKELWTLEELEKDFTLEGMGASPAIFDTEKLDYFNSYYIRQKEETALTDLVRPYLQESGQLERDDISDSQLIKFVALGKDRLKKLSDAPELLSFLFQLPEYPREALRWKKISLEESISCLKEINIEMEKISLDSWNKEYLEQHLLGWIKEQGRANGDYLWPLRYALTGQQYSPGPFEVADALGPEESLRRVKVALDKVK